MVVYDRENQIIYQEGSDGTRIEAGRSTYTELLKLPVDCINADEIKKNLICSDLDAAQLAERQREEHTEQMSEFCIEMVLSTDCNIKLLEKARQKGYFIV